MTPGRPHKKGVEQVTCRVRQVQLESGQRVLAIGGVRGRLALLETLLRRLQFCPGRDALVFLGDLVGGGGQNLETLHFAMDLARLPCVFFLCGDEELLPAPETGADEAVQEAWRQRLAARKDGLFWQLCAKAGLARQAALAQPAAALAAMRPKFARELDFLAAMPHILESRQYLFAHAGLGPGPLKEQNLQTVLAARGFFTGMQRGPAMPKLLTVAHWPAGWYGRTTLCHAPHYSPALKIVSADGGLGLAPGGQLNGAILRGGVYEGFAMADGLPMVRVLRSQPGRGAAVCFTGPDLRVRALRPEPGGRLCLHIASGGQMFVPEGWLCGQGDAWQLRGDAPGWFPPLAVGQTVGLAAGAGRMAMVKLGSHLGWAEWDSLAMPKG